MPIIERWVSFADPATNEELGTVPDMGVAETKEAIEAAAAAFPSWSRTSVKVSLQAGFFLHTPRWIGSTIASPRHSHQVLPTNASAPWGPWSSYRGSALLNCLTSFWSAYLFLQTLENGKPLADGKVEYDHSWLICVRCEELLFAGWEYLQCFFSWGRSFVLKFSNVLPLTCIK